MVRHQAKMIKLEFQFSFVSFQQPQKINKICLLSENDLAVITPAKNMKWKIGNSNSQRSSHTNQVYHKLLEENRVDPIYSFSYHYSKEGTWRCQYIRQKCL